MQTYQHVQCGKVAPMTEGYGFNVENERRRPLMSIVYATPAEAEAACAKVAEALSKALSCTVPGP